MASSIESVHDLLWNKITRGVTDKLEEDGFKVDKWSPNNLRRLIVSPEGVVFQNFITRGTFFNSPITVVSFPVSEATANELNSRTTITSVLYRKRVFSSVEEIVIIPNSPTTPYALSSKELESLQRKLSSFKRLANVIVVKQPITLKDFIASNLKVISNHYTLLAEEGVLGDSLTIPVNKDWYNHTALRPQFYTLDEEGKELSKYFNDVKEKVSNSKSSPVLTQKKADLDKKEPEIDKNEKKSFYKQSKTIVTYRLIQANFLKNREKSSNKQSWFSVYQSVDIRQVKSGLGFRDYQDENFNEALKRLGLYEEEGSTDDGKLKDILGKQIAVSTIKLIDGIKKSYPIFGKNLDKEIKGSISKDMTIEDIRKLATLDYRKPFESEKVLSNTELSLGEKQLLIDGLKGKTRDCLDVSVGILFDLGHSKDDIDIVLDGEQIGDIISKSDRGLEIVVLHDLYIYCNKIEHRMYNSLFSTKGYVTDQPVGERIRLLVKEIESEDDKEWSECENIIDKLKTGKFKRSFERYRDDIINCISKLDYLKDSENVEKAHQVARVTVEALELLCKSDDRKLALVHALGKLTDKVTLGIKGVTSYSEPTVSGVVDTNKQVDNKYSKYLRLIAFLVLAIL